MIVLQNSSETAHRPGNLRELDDLIRKSQEQLTFIAGTTDLMVNSEKWKRLNNFVDLTSVEELNSTIEEKNQGLLIGAAVPLTDIAENELVQSQFPILETVCRLIGSIQIQNRATLGGNIGNASPAADSLPVLNVLNAELLIGPAKNGAFEKVPVQKIMKGPGETILENNQYIAYIFIPTLPSDSYNWYFRKVGQRLSMVISKVSLAALADVQDGKLKDIRLSAGAVTPVVTRASETEKFLKDKSLNSDIIDEAAEILKSEISPIADIRSTVEYRREVCGRLLREALWMFM